MDNNTKDVPQITEQEWTQLCRQYSNGCALCGKGEGVVPDLVVPPSYGGSLGVDNVQPLCARCRSVKQGYLVDYRPHESPVILGTKDEARATAFLPSRRTLQSCPIPKIISQRQLLAIEYYYNLGNNGLIEDPIVEYDVETMLVAELKRLRALVMVNPALARVESIVWRERYAALMPRPK